MIDTDDEIIELLMIPKIGRKKARALYSAGYRTIDDIAEADVGKLGQVSGIWDELAAEIKDFAQSMVEASGGSPEDKLESGASLFVCPMCGSMVGSESEQCSNCGIVFSDDEEEEADVGVKPEPEIKEKDNGDGYWYRKEVPRLYICPECGALISGAADGCSNCGAVFDGEEGGDEEPAPERTGEKDDADGFWYQKRAGLFICPNCGAFIPEDAEKCQTCGIVFEGEEEDLPREPVETFCPNCSAKLEADTDICTSCGFEFRKAKEDEPDGFWYKEQTTLFVCPNCGVFIPETAGECPQCGIVFEGVDEEEVKVIKPPLVKEMEEEFDQSLYLCQACGAFVSGSAKNCSVCGADVSEEDEDRRTEDGAFQLPALSEEMTDEIKAEIDEIESEILEPPKRDIGLPPEPEKKGVSKDFLSRWKKKDEKESVVKDFKKRWDTVQLTDDEIEKELGLDLLTLPETPDVGRLQDIDDALYSHPDSFELWEEKADILTSLDRADEAIACWDKAAELNPERETEYKRNILGLLEVGIDKDFVDISDLTEIDEEGELKIDDELLEDKTREQVAEIDQKLEENPEDEALWQEKGELLEQLGEHEEAIKCFDESIRLSYTSLQEETDGVALSLSLPEIAFGLTNGHGRVNGRVNGLLMQRGLINGVGRVNGVGKVNGLVNGGLINGLVNGRVNGRGQVNGLINGGLVNGRVNGQGRVNGLINGGLVNGKVNGLINGQGLVNGEGLINGRGRFYGSRRIDRERREWRYRVSWVVMLVALVLLVPMFANLLSPPGAYAISIDGNFSDWQEVTTFYDSTSDQVDNPDLNILETKSVFERDRLDTYVRVERTALGGAGLNNSVDTIFLFIDTDSDENTGYLINGLGADLLTEIYGWNNNLQTSSLYRFSGQGGQSDWNSFEKERASPCAVQGSELEVRTWIPSDMIIDDMNPEVLAICVNSLGYSDQSDAVMSMLPSSLDVRSFSIGPDALNQGSSDIEMLRIELRSFAGPSSVSEINFTLKGSLDLTRVANVRVFNDTNLDGVFNPLIDAELGRVNPLGSADFAIPLNQNVGLARGGAHILFLVADLNAGSFNQTIGFEVSDVNADGLVTVNNLERKLHNIGIPTGFATDGAFGDWNGISRNVDGANDVESPDYNYTTINHNIDLADARFGYNGWLFVYFSVSGVMMGGSDIPTIRLRPGPPGPPPVTDSDDDTVPDADDPMPYDFDNNGVDDLDENGDRDGDGALDYDTGGTDYWLNTTIPLTGFPANYTNRSVSIYIGPIGHEENNGEDHAYVLIDSDDNVMTGTNLLGAFGVDHILAIAGEGNQIITSELYEYNIAGSPGVWTFVDNIDAAVDWYRMEAGVNPNLLGIAPGDDFSIAISIEDWKGSHDESDSALDAALISAPFSYSGGTRGPVVTKELFLHSNSGTVFSEDFESGSLSGDWTVAGTGDAGAGTYTSNSGSYSMFTRWNPVTVTSRAIDLSGRANAAVSYWARRGADTFSENPDAGEDLVIEYLNNVGAWVQLDNFAGDGTAGQIYNPTHYLPADALHSGFSLRFTQTEGSGVDWDYWHVDDVLVSGDATFMDRSAVWGGTTSDAFNHSNSFDIYLQPELAANLMINGTAQFRAYLTGNTSYNTTVTAILYDYDGATETSVALASVDLAAGASGWYTFSLPVGMYNFSANNQLNLHLETEIDPVSFGPVAYWMLDEAGGTDAVDATGNGHNGTLVNMDPPNDWVNGTFDAGLDFDGADDQVQTSTDLNQWLGGTASVSVWFQTTQTGSDTAWLAPGITGTESAGDGNDIFWGFLDASGNIGIQPGDGARAMSLIPVNDGGWHNAVFTRNQATGLVEVYIDGVFQDSAISDTGLKTTSFSAFGMIEDTAGTHTYFAGSIDDLQVYDRVLTPSEIRQIYLASNGFDVSVSYDSAAHPTRLELPSESYVNVEWVRTYNATTGLEQAYFQPGETVLVRANITDPFGIYDIVNATADITSPGGLPGDLADDAAMTTEAEDSVFPYSWRIYNLTYNVPPGAVNGYYNVDVTGVEGNMVTHTLNASFEINTTAFPQITVEKVADRAAVVPGDLVTYIIYYNNTGAGNASNVWINDTLPADIAFSTSMPLPDGTSGQTQYWNFTNVAPGSYSIVITADVSGSATVGSVLTNQVTCNYTDLFGTQLPGSWDSASVTVVSAASNVLMNEISIQPDGNEWVEIVNPTAAPVDISGWRIRRVGPGLDTRFTAPPGTILGPWGSGTEFFVADLGGGNDLPDGGRTVYLEWNSPGPGWTTIDQTTYPGGIAATQTWSRFKNATTGIPDDTDNDANDWYVSNNGWVAPEGPTMGYHNDRHRPVISVEKVGNATIAAQGTNVQYTIYYNNIGDGLARDVWVNDTVPVGMTFISSSVAPSSIFGRLYSWHFNNVPRGTTNSLSVTLQVNASVSTGTVLTNIAELNYTDQLRRPMEYSVDSWDVLVSGPIPDITVQKNASSSQVVPGGGVSYTIWYNNTGTGNAGNVWLNDTLPADIAFYTATPSPNSVLGQIQYWHFTNVPPGTHSIIVYGNVSMTAAVGSVLTNIVTCDYTDMPGSPLPSSSDSASVTVVNPMFLILMNEISIQPDGNEWVEIVNPTAAPVDISGWRIRRVGPGPDTRFTAPAGTILGPWGSGSEFFVADLGGGNDLPDGGRTVYLEWNSPGPGWTTIDQTTYPGGIAATQTWSRFKHEDTGMPVDTDNDANDWYISNNGWIVPEGPTPAAPNDRKRPVMVIEKTATPDPVQPGDLITYTIWYNNTGDGNAKRVWVNDTLPTNVDFISSSIAPTVQSGQDIRWYFNNIVHDTTNSLTVTVQVNANASDGETLVNVVGLIYHDALQRPMGTSTAWANVTCARPQITVEKIVDLTNANASDFLTYTIYYNNTGSVNAGNVWINDTLPNFVTFISSNPAATSSSGLTYYWHFTNVAPGTHSISITVQVNATAPSGLITNWAFLNYSSSADYSLEESSDFAVTMIPEMQNVGLAIFGIMIIAFIGIRKKRNENE